MLDALKVLFILTGASTYLVTKYIRIGIGDKNDNPPYFDQAQYEAEVNEDDDMEHTVIMATAKHKNEFYPKIPHEIAKGLSGAFLVKNETPSIYAAGPLAHQNRKEYKVRLVKSDKLNDSTVTVRLKDARDSAPAFDRPTYETQIIEEDDRLLPRPLLQVTTSDGDDDALHTIVYFLTGQGVDDENPRDRKFSINASTGDIYLLKALDRDLPYGQPQWRFTIFAEVEGSNGLVGHADLLVNLKDINDNAPIFSHSFYIGNVSENGTAGMPVMTMTAIDHDDINEGSNAKITYSIEQNQANENHELIFTIDEHSGLISTAVCCLDRESNPEYTIKVVATDGGGLKGSATATIKIKDINDMPPTFTKSEWFVEVTETIGDTLPLLPILIVSVNDGDLFETNRFFYRVVGGSSGADKFTMVTNSDGTGSLKVAKPLDYEHFNDKWGFNITIEVSDQGGQSTDPYHTDYAKVYITLRDINDNRPHFIKSHIEVTVLEDAPVGTSLAHFTASDADQGGKCKITYKIDRSSDRKRQFTIDQTGRVTIQRMLDREDISRYNVNVLAVDDGYPAHTATATLTVFVDDINDNAPRFLKDYRPVIMEHSLPQTVLEIFAIDDDDRYRGNGPPFTFHLDTNSSSLIKNLFHVQHDLSGANGDGSAILSSKSSFDREEQKEYLIPIVIRDAGSMMSTSTLTVIIGDVNDNTMRSASKKVTVYIFKNRSLSTRIGTVYVDDLDDWDVADKSFFWSDGDNHPNFYLDEKSGMITMHDAKVGTYNLRFTVYDRKYSAQVDANVSVTVKEISDEAINESGSMRLSGVTAEQFFRLQSKSHESMYDKLKSVLSRTFQVDRDNVDMFTVMSRSDRPPVTDVRFAVRGGKYFKSEYLDATVALHRGAIEQAVGVEISMVGINECMQEGVNCEGSCSNQLTISNTPLLVNANETSFVSVNAYVIPSCVCASRDYRRVESCSDVPHPCLNGGSCTDSSVGPVCSCPAGYDGPRCQKTSMTFDGNGWAWFKPLQQCEQSHLSVEIMTRTSTGLILYNGPLRASFNSPSDFISLELHNGVPRLLIDYGSGTVELIVRTLGDLHDGNWHRLDVFWNREKVRLLVDNCQGARVHEEMSTIDRSRCENETTMPVYNEFLNVNSPLQLGGVSESRVGELYQHYKWKYQHTSVGLNGCIKNVIHNSVTYDLASPGSYLNAFDGCAPADASCKSKSITRSCDQGICIGSYNSARCHCKPGWYGLKCDKKTQSKLLQADSYIKYALSFDLDTYKSDIQLNFRTRRDNGELLRMASKHGRQYGILEIREKKIVFRFNLHRSRSEELQVTLAHVTVCDGQWHTVQVLRYGSTASISLDGGGGVRYSEINEYNGLHQLMTVEKQSVIAGGDVQYVAPGQTLVDNDFHDGCINDIRLDQRYLPMENGSENAAVVESKNIIDGCPSNNPCDGVLCQKPFVCVDQWMLHQCRCEGGYTLSRDGRNCINTDECINSPCLNGGICKNVPSTSLGFYCICPSGFSGELCNALKQEKIITLSATALAAILICLVNIVIVTIVIAAYSRSRRSRNEKCSPAEVDDDVRENIVRYNDEGGGEDDMQAFDIRSLRIPVDSTGTPIAKTLDPAAFLPSKSVPSHVQVDIGVFLEDRLEKLYYDSQGFPFEDVRTYAYEGCGSTAGSLSSLNSRRENIDKDFDFDLNTEHFLKSTDIYIHHTEGGGST